MKVLVALTGQSMMPSHTLALLIFLKRSLAPQFLQDTVFVITLVSYRYRGTMLGNRMVLNQKFFFKVSTQKWWYFSLPVESVVVFLYPHAARRVASLNCKFVIFCNFKFLKTEFCYVARICPTAQNATQNCSLFTHCNWIGTVVLFNETSSSCCIDGHVDQGVAAVDEETRLDYDITNYTQLGVWINLVVNYHMALGKNVYVRETTIVCILTSAGSTVGHSSLWSLQSDMPSHRQADGTQRPLNTNCWGHWTQQLVWATTDEVQVSHSPLHARKLLLWTVFLFVALAFQL